MLLGDERLAAAGAAESGCSHSWTGFSLLRMKWEDGAGLTGVGSSMPAHRALEGIREKDRASSDAGHGAWRSRMSWRLASGVRLNSRRQGARKS